MNVKPPIYMLSISLKAFLSVAVASMAVTSSLPIVFVMDFTFKCNDNKIPLLELGITDA
jgi:hypothetical protein